MGRDPGCLLPAGRNIRGCGLKPVIGGEKAAGVFLNDGVQDVYGVLPERDHRAAAQQGGNLPGMMVVNFHVLELLDDDHPGPPQDRAEVIDALADGIVHLIDRLGKVPAAHRIKIAVAARMKREDFADGQIALMCLHPFADGADTIEVAPVCVVQVG